MIASTRLKRILSAVGRCSPDLLSQRIGLVSTSQSSTMACTPKTAGIVIIGDEILKGQTLDTNSQKICKRFFEMGFKVRKIVIIPDDIDAIAEQVAQFASSYDFVVTTGGIGPTHDDMTYEGVAKGFGLRLFRHPTLVQLLESHFGTDRSHPAFKMSEVPETATIMWNQQQKRSFPLVKIKNVFILPGIPSLMERCLRHLYEILEPNATPAPNVASIFVSLDEVSLTDTLNSAVQQFKTSVTFGSYPTVSNNYYRVHLTLESHDEKKLEEAQAFLKDKLPQGSLVSYNEDSTGRAIERLYNSLEQPDSSLTNFLESLKQSVKCLEECLTTRYTPEQVCISFNGGKDCTALLHLYHCVLNKLFPSRKNPILGLYIKCQNPFPEVEHFIGEVSERYNLKLCTVNGPIKTGLQEFLSSNPGITAILMGNRKTDPKCQDLDIFQMTDSDWPQVMRVFPLLKWSYSEIWKFIRHFYVPYCALYDQGYTSLGSFHNTTPNPDLRYVTEKGEIQYYPAYMLDDHNMERNGRH